MFKSGAVTLALTLAPAVVSTAAAEDTTYDRISAYLSAYTEVLDGNSAALTAEGYERATPPERSRVQIVAGRLVMAAEKMMADGSDPRAERWTGFIRNISGPLCDRTGFSLEDYAATGRMRDAIAGLRSSSCKKS